jgi:HSP20 family protein
MFNNQKRRKIMDKQNDQKNQNIQRRSNSSSGTILSDFFDSDNFWEMPKLFSGRNQSLPAVNVKETDREYEIELAAPGIPKENIHVDVENDMLIIKGENTSQHESTGSNNFTRREFSSSSFERRFRLPEDVDLEKINASYKNGIVDIVVPKTENNKRKKRQIELS